MAAARPCSELCHHQIGHLQNMLLYGFPIDISKLPDSVRVHIEKANRPWLKPEERPSRRHDSVGFTPGQPGAPIARRCAQRFPLTVYDISASA